MTTPVRIGSPASGLGAFGTEAVVALTVDVEWAHPAVLADTVALIEARGLHATFFCTHPGIELTGHERGLHPNFRRYQNTALAGVPNDELARWTDEEFYRFIMRAARSWCPAASGVRSHALFCEAALPPIYHEEGLQYDSSIFLPLAAGIAPVERLRGLTEIPIYYMDHWDLMTGATGFEVDRLMLDRPGLKVLDFHPTLVYINASTPDQYEAAKRCYQVPEQLARLRHSKRGCRTLFVEVLDFLARRSVAAGTLGELNTQWRLQSAA